MRNRGRQSPMQGNVINTITYNLFYTEKTVVLIFLKKYLYKIVKNDVSV